LRKTKTKRPRLKGLQTLKQDVVKIYCEEVYKINHQESMTVRFQRQGGLSLGGTMGDSSRFGGSCSILKYCPSSNG